MKITSSKSGGSPSESRDGGARAPRLYANELELETAAFRALSVGIGLGEVRAPQPKNKTRGLTSLQNSPREPSTSAQDLSLLTARPPLESDPSQNFEFPDRSKEALPQRSEPRARRLLKSFFAFGIDALIVALSIAVALIVAGFVVSWHGGSTSANAALTPLRWLLSMDPRWLASLYGAMYLLYFVTLRLVAGGSLGDSLVATPTSLSDPRKQLN